MKYVGKALIKTMVRGKRDGIRKKLVKRERKSKVERQERFKMNGGNFCGEIK